MSTFTLSDFLLPQSSVDLRIRSQAEETRITQGRKIVLLGNGLATSPGLHSLLFSDIQKLTMNSNSRVQVEANRAMSLRIQRIGTLNLKPSAFLGWHSALATISIADTESVHIDQDAFPTDSTFRRVHISSISTLTLDTGAIRSTIDRLVLENIRSLQLHPGAIRGRVGNLRLRNVTIESCPDAAFGGSIDSATFSSVTLISLETHCLDAGGGWRHLALSDSQLDLLSPRSIHGAIDNITISGCRLVGVRPEAVSVSAVRVSLTNSVIGELAPRALQVRATSSVSLEEVIVTQLRPDALSGLQVADNTTSGDGGGGLSISGLTLRRAEPGSLRFADGAPVTLTNLLLTGGCVCSSPSWAHQLLLGSPDDSRDAPPTSDDPAPERDSLLRQIEAGHCTVGDSRVSLANFTARSCGDGPARSSGAGPVQSSEDGPVQSSGAGPVQSKGDHPVQSSGAGPVQSSEDHPVQSSGAGPVQSSEDGPVQSSGAGPVQSSGAGPIQSSGAGPVQSSEDGAVQSSRGDGSVQSSGDAGRVASVTAGGSALVDCWWLGMVILGALLIATIFTLALIAARYRRLRQKRHSEGPEPVYAMISEHPSSGDGLLGKDSQPPDEEDERQTLYVDPEGFRVPTAEPDRQKMLYANLHDVPKPQRRGTVPAPAAAVRTVLSTDPTVRYSNQQECVQQPTDVKPAVERAATAVGVKANCN